MSEPLSAPPVRRLYRLVSEEDPPLRAFFSQAEEGRRYDDPEVQRRAEEVSVWDSFERVVRLASKKPQLRYVAVLEVPASVELTPGKRGHLGIPKGTGAAQIRGWVVDVVAVP